MHINNGLSGEVDRALSLLLDLVHTHFTAMQRFAVLVKVQQGVCVLCAHPLTCSKCVYCVYCVCPPTHMQGVCVLCVLCVPTHSHAVSVCIVCIVCAHPLTCSECVYCVYCVYPPTHMQGVLDRLEYLTTAQIRKLYQVLAVLGFSDPERGSAIQDELRILIRKQLLHTEQR